MNDGWQEVWFRSPDGLNLFARDYRPASNGPVPIICLPGLTRNSRDFEAIAPRLARRRRVVAPDYRGRGRSEYAQDWNSYRPDIELADIIALLDHLAIPSVAVIGTSRGGIIGMLMGATHRDRLAGLLLNDIGPELERAGLLRIASHVGAREEPGAWPEAIARLKRDNPGYETLSDAEWEIMARRIFREENGRVRADYDRNLARPFPAREDIEAGKASDLWAFFETLSGLPVTVLRGEHSDLLSERTVKEMQRHHPGLDSITVRDRGHIPLLTEPESIAAIDRWLARIDARLLGDEVTKR